MSSESHVVQKAIQETVTSVHYWTDTLLTFTVTKPPGYSFVAGQYARLGLEDNNGIIWRAYSMTSSPHAEELEFYGVLVNGGLFTSRLEKIKPGDSIWLEKTCYGFLTIDRFPDGENLWMVATGTGIGPYISILRDPAAWEKFDHLLLVHGTRYGNEFSYREILNDLQKRPPSSAGSVAKLHLIEATTREPALLEPSSRLHGRLTTLIENEELEKKAGIPLDITSSRVMLCGNPAMIEEMRALLHQRGMKPARRATPGQFITENYW